MKCWQCDFYKGGKGSNACIKCDEAKNINPRSAPCVEYQSLPSEIIENLSLPYLKDYYKSLDDEQAVLMFRRFHLEQTLPELAIIYNVTKQAIDQRIKKSLTIIKTYASY